MRVRCIHATTTNAVAALPVMLAFPVGTERLQPSILGWGRLDGKAVSVASRRYLTKNHRRLSHLAQVPAICCQGRPGDRLASRNQAAIRKMRMTALASWHALLPCCVVILISHGHRNPASRRHSQQPV